MFQPSFVIPRLDSSPDFSSSPDVYLLTRSDGHLVKGPDGYVYSKIPPDIEKYIQCRLFLGRVDGISWWGIGIRSHVILPAEYSLVTLREVVSGEGHIQGMACRAIQLVRFDAITRFCGYCGGRVHMKSDEHAKICSSCGRIVFPKLSPAVIVRITDGNRILLSRSPHFPPGMYSVQAGFVEPGESLEATVHREVFEEIGIEISEFSYFGSQPWPFPDSLMIGFTATYAGGDIAIDGREIEDAGWYEASHLPPLPGPDSIARALIEDWLASEKR